MDPLVFPSNRLEAVSAVKIETIEKGPNIATSNFKTPRRSNKTVWAPINGVFAQNTLLSNPELAKQSDIHFTVNNISASPQLVLNTTKLLRE